jgi:hypothetical protein
MSVESFLSQAEISDTEITLNPRVIAELHTLAEHRGIISVDLADFTQAATKRRKRFESPVKRMLDFAHHFFEEGLDAALEKVGTRGGVRVRVIIPNTEYETYADERHITGRLVGLVGFSRDWDAPTFDGIAVVRNRRQRDFLAVRVSETGAIWLNPIHLTQQNRQRTGREVVEQLFPNAQKSLRRKRG